jgi:hypothetical protein
MEVLALLALILVWPVGAVLLWLSRVWSTRDKLIGVLVPPGGYPAMVLGIMRLLWTRQHCYGGTYALDWVFITVVIGALGMPIVSALYLALRARRRAAAPRALSPLLLAAGIIAIVTVALTVGLGLAAPRCEP